MNLSELIEQTPPLGAFALDFQYFLIAENQYSQEALLKIRNIVSTLFLAESYYDVDVLEVELLNLFSSEADKEAVSLFLNWFRQLAFHGRIESDDYQSLESIYQNEEEVKTMLVTALERERERFFKTVCLKVSREVCLKVSRKVELKRRLKLQRQCLPREWRLRSSLKLPTFQKHNFCC